MEVTQKPRLHQDWIDSHAYGIVKALQKGGFETYLVGGCVRDLLLGIHPKDFDIATMAPPPQVKRLIYNAYIIGKRFRLVLVKRDQQQFEVATFRREVRAEEFPEGAPFGDNVFGTSEEDARRRDFTINGLLYDPIEDKLIDYVDGMKDIESRMLRMIGDPDARLVEDPIRSLRALRFCYKLGFTLEPGLRAAIQRHASELVKSVLPRRREEILKILRLEEPDLALLEAFDLDLLKYVLPTLHDLMKDPEKCEIFLDHFRRNHRMAPETADTIHLFGWLVFSFFQTVTETEGRENDRPEDVIFEDRFQNFMRDELGMFKFEQLTVSKALETVGVLQRADDIKKRGERRQFAVVRSDGFALAIQMAEVDYLLTPEHLQFWKDLLVRFQPELARMVDDEKSKRRGARRRRPRRGERGERGGSRGGGSTGERADSENESDADGELEADTETDTALSDNDAVGFEAPADEEKAEASSKDGDDPSTDQQTRLH